MDEILAFEVLALLINEISDDSIEIAINFLKECGAHLEDVARSLVYRCVLMCHVQFVNRKPLTCR